MYHNGSCRLREAGMTAGNDSTARNNVVRSDEGNWAHLPIVRQIREAGASARGFSGMRGALPRHQAE